MTLRRSRRREDRCRRPARVVSGTTGTFALAARPRLRGSWRSAETSLITWAPDCSAASITATAPGIHGGRSAHQNRGLDRRDTRSITVAFPHRRPAGPRAFAADIDDRRARLPPCRGGMVARDRIVEELAAVGEAVGRDVEDAHHLRLVEPHQRSPRWQRRQRTPSAGQLAAPASTSGAGRTSGQPAPASFRAVIVRSFETVVAIARRSPRKPRATMPSPAEASVASTLSRPPGATTWSRPDLESCDQGLDGGGDRAGHQRIERGGPRLRAPGARRSSRCTAAPSAASAPTLVDRARGSRRSRLRPSARTRRGASGACLSNSLRARCGSARLDQRAERHAGASCAARHRLQRASSSGSAVSIRSSAAAR